MVQAEADARAEEERKFKLANADPGNGIPAPRPQVDPANRTVLSDAVRAAPPENPTLGGMIGQRAEYAGKKGQIAVNDEQLEQLLMGVGKKYQVGSLDEGSRRIREFISSGDTVLFENYLPDNYNEN